MFDSSRNDSSRNGSSRSGISHCGIVILAAGGATRMGRPKQLLKLGPATLVRRCCKTALATSCRPVCVVLGANSEAIKPHISDLDVTVIVNPAWQRGIGTSIRMGVAAVLHCQAVALLLCDQPLITAGAIERLVISRRELARPIAAAAYSGTLGTPAVFAAEMFRELLTLADQQGGKSILQRHANEVHPVEIPEAAIDIDTEDDYQRVTTSLR